MINREFWVPIIPGRLTRQHRDALSVTARLVMWLSAAADPQKGTWFVQLAEFATWAACSHTQARRALEELEQSGWVVELQRRSRGTTGKLGEMFRLAGDPDMTAAARAYQFATGMRAHSDERKRMCAVVGTVATDVRLWQTICEQWQKDGHNAANIDGLLDKYMKVKTAPPVATPAAATEDYSGYRKEGYFGEGDKDESGD